MIQFLMSRLHVSAISCSFFSARPEAINERRQIESVAIEFIILAEPVLQPTPTKNPGFGLYEGESIAFPVRFVEVKSKRGVSGSA
jgi:hypothetical protein